MTRTGAIEKSNSGMLAGNPALLEMIISRYSRELLTYACQILTGAGSHQDAEECINDVFVIVWQKWRSFDSERGSLRNWLYMHTKYLALTRRRQLLYKSHALKNTVPLFEETLIEGSASEDDLNAAETPLYQSLNTAGIDMFLAERERREEMRQALERLSEQDRLLVYLRYFQLASHAEIAQRTGLSKHAVETRLWRARKSLRAALTEKDQRDAPCPANKDEGAYKSPVKGNC